MNTTTKIIILAVLFIGAVVAAYFVGYNAGENKTPEIAITPDDTFKDTKPAEIAAVVHDTVVEYRDRIIEVEGRAPAAMVPVITSQGDLVAENARLSGLVDSLLTELLLALGENGVEDLVAQAHTSTPLYNLDQTFWYQDRTFSHTLTFNAELLAKQDCDGTFWNDLLIFLAGAAAGGLGVGIAVQF